ncbi:MULTISPECIES: DUF3551 domain-containing protein [Bradyrhizobium]|uniref:Uncharacterized protein n=1 Tax=Bradyrhizobium nanningense TaxID=1325118 RepID=A0A4Q0SBB5_9BRAD|nr:MULTISPECIES: DUF3551 domain-containing protein [Bradyrhizobium]RXH35567.1 hypothetical protein XH99_07430 [Bradyrhizobium nanningense]RXH36324.1 hypothetical protein XH84_03660 [Bradyrhizobium nanningense]TQF29633.1 hypothetical protein UNPA324_08280 [Bradyrhizobium sp. UNPA324]
MRRVPVALLSAGVLLATAAAHAQTYDPSYPVCMQIYGPVGYFDCRYGSLEQCKYLAVGRSASCVVNPYFPPKKPARRARPATQTPTPRSP